jgi:deoxyuridine 5'-triphosphate nucleotidohydrolase
MITVSGPHPENIHHPQRKGDVGYDLSISEETCIWSDRVVWAKTGVCLAFPEGIWGEIIGRSSTMAKHHLVVVHSVIDTGYTGELTIGIWNTNFKQVHLTAGTRIAQLILRLTVLEDLRLGSLPSTERGAEGFGSTGA